MRITKQKSELKKYVLFLTEKESISDMAGETASLGKLFL